MCSSDRWTGSANFYFHLESWEQQSRCWWYFTALLWNNSGLWLIVNTSSAQLTRNLLENVTNGRKDRIKRSDTYWCRCGLNFESKPECCQNNPADCRLQSTYKLIYALFKQIRYLLFISAGMFHVVGMWLTLFHVVGVCLQ